MIYVKPLYHVLQDYVKSCELEEAHLNLSHC